MFVTFWIIWHKISSKPLPIINYTYTLPQSEIIGIDARGSAVAFSPDGTKLIYVSNRSDTSMLYLHNMDEFGAEPIAVTKGASSPFFSPDGREIYYKDPSGSRLMAVPIFTDPEVNVGESRTLFEGKFKTNHMFGPNYDISADGKKFLMIEEEEESSRATRINVILNWVEDLKRLVPIDK